MTPNELVLTFLGSYVRANFGENRSRNATVRVPTDGQTHTQTHTHTQTQTDFIICPMLYAIAMGQINIIRLCESQEVADRPRTTRRDDIDALLIWYRVKTDRGCLIAYVHVNGGYFKQKF